MRTKITKKLSFIIVIAPLFLLRVFLYYLCCLSIYQNTFNRRYVYQANYSHLPCVSLGAFFIEIPMMDVKLIILSEFIYFPKLLFHQCRMLTMKVRLKQESSWAILSSLSAVISFGLYYIEFFWIIHVRMLERYWYHLTILASAQL